jgi:hypothetical protein
MVHIFGVVRLGSQTYVATGEKILEFARTAPLHYAEQSSAEPRRLLDIVLSNCSFDCGSLSPTDANPFDLLVQGTKLKIGGEGRIRTLSGPLDSVTYRFRNAVNAKNAADAVAHCPPLPADAGGPTLL